AHFSSLATQNDFPLVRIARLRAAQVCPVQNTRIEDVLGLAQEAWLKDASIRTAHEVAKAKKDKRNEAKLALDVSRQALLQSEKVTLVQRALELAQELKDPALEAQAKKRLVEVAPRFKTAPTEKEYLKVATDIRQTRDFDRARQMYT